MQFRDLAKQYQVLKSDIDQAMLSVASGAHYIMGPEVKELEQQLAEYVGVKHCLTCANGTDALTLALKAWGIGPGDAVFVPDFTFFASAEVVALEGATPVFVDVDDTTFNIDADSLEKAISLILAEGKLTPKVIIAVDLFGLPANYPAVKAVAEKYGLLILEDGAQGFGGSISNLKPQISKACSFGDIATTSFFPAKPLGCYGDGGAVFTNNDEWAGLVNSYRVHGKGTDKYDNVRIGMNSRLDTLQAAILQVKLRAFDREVENVNEAARHYTKLLKDYVKTPVIPEGFGSSWAQYTIQLPDEQQRNRLQAALKEAGIPSMVYYPKPMHEQTAFQHLTSYLLPHTSVKLSQTVLSLPMHPYLEAADIEHVCSVLIASL
ncbi:MAG: DegT/DnrJ/EryC1/StrS family aminotransferase [Prevotella sp.]|nr:DegT/DnrJ/EryC1/StrS family aminotransferase [Prevotella sp.]